MFPYWDDSCSIGLLKKRVIWKCPQNQRIISNDRWTLSWFGLAPRGRRWQKRIRRCITRKSQNNLENYEGADRGRQKTTYWRSETTPSIAHERTSRLQIQATTKTEIVIKERPLCFSITISTYPWPPVQISKSSFGEVIFVAWIHSIHEIKVILGGNNIN